jgi:hypothetical protein
MRKIIVIISILIFLSILQPVLAQNIAQNFPQFPYQTWWNPDALATFLGLPADWLVVPKVIYYVIVPFITAVTVTYGILTELRIFRSVKGNRINALIAILMSFSLLPSGILTIVVTYFYAFNTMVGLIGFGVLFFVGVILWVYGTSHRMWGEYGSAKSMARDIHDLNKQIRDVQKQISDLQALKRDPGVPTKNYPAIDTQIGKLQDRLATLQAQRADMHQKLQGI